tara:strand:+ start:10613 stop:11560 length:948 start_codon:yes stop_codon:yes gene_type:complete
MSGNTLQTSGKIKMSDIVSVFGGAKPHKLKEYYRDGDPIPNIGINQTIPTNGTIKYSDFYGSGLQTVEVIEKGQKHITTSNPYALGSSTGYSTINTLSGTLGSETKIIITYVHIGTSSDANTTNPICNVLVNGQAKSVSKILDAGDSLRASNQGGAGIRAHNTTVQLICNIGNTSSFQIRLAPRNQYGGFSAGRFLHLIAQVDGASFTTATHSFAGNKNGGTQNNPDQPLGFTIQTANPSCSVVSDAKYSTFGQAGGSITNVFANGVALADKNKIVDATGDGAIGLDPSRTGETVNYTFNTSGSRSAHVGGNYRL